jgi:hypothetical protein
VHGFAALRIENTDGHGACMEIDTHNRG